MIGEYAGIGSRETPENICKFMTTCATFLADNDYVLRSGAAIGADAAFEVGANLYFKQQKIESNSKIFLPWKRFNGSDSKLYLESFPEETIEAAQKLAIKYYHSKSMTPNTLRYMTRNVMQILDSSLCNPVNFVVCYTKDGKVSGGTGQALRIAEDHNIPIYNLFHKEQTRKFLEEKVLSLV